VTSIIKKGDIINTALSNNTIVLKVQGKNALLFDIKDVKFVIAYGVQKEDDYVFWNQGDYFDELPDNIFER